MRIASNQFHATMNTALQTANNGLTLVMQQMASSKRILVPSDDTIATVRLSRLMREEAALDQYRDNIGALRTRLQSGEATLDSITQDMQVTRDLLVWAADGANAPEDLKAMAGSLVALRDSLFYAANTRNAEGRFLFSGTATDQQPLVRDDSTTPATYTYRGNAGVQQVAVAEQVTVTANVNVEEMAGFLSQLERVIVALNEPTATANSVRADVATGLDELDKTMSAVGRKISEIGGRQNILQTMDDNHAALSLANQQSVLDLAALDYGEAATRLSSYTLAVEASQKAYARISSLSLFNVF